MTTDLTSWPCLHCDAEKPVNDEIFCADCLAQGVHICPAPLCLHTLRAGEPCARCEQTAQKLAIADADPFIQYMRGKLSAALTPREHQPA